MFALLSAVILLLFLNGDCKSIVDSKKVDHKNVAVELMLEKTIKDQGKLLSLSTQDLKHF